MESVMIVNYQAFLALVLAGFVGGVAGYIGSLMISKRMALIGGAFGHLALPGVSLALVYNFDVGLGALLILTVGVLGIWLLHYRTHLPFEALTGVMFAVSLAVSFLILPKKELDIALLGDISRLTIQGVIIGCLAAVGIFFLVRRVYARLILATISEEIAKVEYRSLERDNFLYLLCIGFVVALGVRIVGGLMTAALVTIPAATSSNISASLFQYAYLSMLLGIVSCCLGVVLHLLTGGPVGPLIILTSGAFFGLSLLVPRRS